MRTTLDLREDLVRDLMSLRKWSSKKRAIETAMERYIKEEKVKGLLALRGKLRIEDRSRRLRELELREG